MSLVKISFQRHSSFFASLSSPFSIWPGSLIDFETTGRPGLDPSHEVIALGYMVSAQAVVLGRMTADKSSFYGVLAPLLESLPRPFLAYNAPFEMAVMTEELGMQVAAEEFVDVMAPWRAKAESMGLKWPRLDELVSEPGEYFGEAHISGRDVPALWKEYLEERCEGAVRRIMEHCFSDLIREALLVVRHGSPFEG